MKLAVPDMISNSYFPALAAVELGFFAAQGLDVSLEMIFPVSRAYEALRDGSVDLVAGSAHAALSAFPDWHGVKLLCAQAQGMYWFLVMRADRAGARGDLSVVKQSRIGAAPWVEMGLARLLADAGFDLRRDGIELGPMPILPGAGLNFGLNAARALEEGIIDGFWANGMGALAAVQSGVGRVVLDVRRGDGPAHCFNYTMASLAASDRMLESAPEQACAAVRAIVNTQQALRADLGVATQVGKKLFPAKEAAMIAETIQADLPFYSAAISQEFVAGMNGFCQDLGLLQQPAPYERVVAGSCIASWQP